jgi:hypothetical protein
MRFKYGDRVKVTGGFFAGQRGLAEDAVPYGSVAGARWAYRVRLASTTGPGGLTSPIDEHDLEAE